MKKTCIVYLSMCAAVCLLLLTGCSNFLAPVRGFLMEYTENAAIDSVSFLVPVQVDNEGYTSVRSGAPAELRFLMRNPQCYNLAVSLAFDDPGITATQGSDYTFTLSADRQSVNLEFSDAFLRAHEPAGNISGTVTLTDPGTGRSFPPYSFRLRSNSPPPRPSGLRIMQNAGSYVVCFNLDLSDSVHNDIAGVYVNSTYYPVQSVSAGGSPAISFVSSDAGTSEPAALDVLPGGAVFDPDAPAQVPIYIDIKEAVSVDNKNFTIRIVDAKGLDSSAATTSKGTKLNQALLYDAEGALLSGMPTLITRADDGLAGLEVRAPSTDANGDPVTGVQVRYEILRASALYASGSGAASAQVWLGKSAYSVRAWASKQGYLDSDVVSLPVTVKGTHLFVHPTSGDDTTGDGSKLRPYKTVEHAFAQVPGADGEVYILNLMGNITIPESGPGATSMIQLTTMGSDARTVVIEGEGHVIDGGQSKRCLHVLSQNLDLTISNLTVQNGKALDVGAGIHFETGNKLSIINGSRVINNLIDTNDDATGGGVRFVGNELIIQDSTIEGNSITTTGIASGGGVNFDGQVFRMSNSSIVHNSIASSNRAYGGGVRIVDTSGNAVSISGSFINQNSIITDGDESYGGGIHINSAQEGKILFENTSISSNSMTYNNTVNSACGGGLSILGKYNAVLHAVTTQANTITSNAAGQGGGVYFKGNNGVSSRLEISLNSVISGNSISARDYAQGGGVYAVDYFTLNFSNSTFTLNRLIKTEAAGAASVEGGGIAVNNGAVGNSFAITSCTVSNNTIQKGDATIGNFNYGYGAGIACYSNTFTSNGNLIQGNTISGTNYGYGGGVLLPQSATSTLTNTRIIGNLISASNMGLGGGLAVYGSGSASIKGGEISGNNANTSALGNGGGIYVALSSTCTIGDTAYTTTIRGNTASGSTNGFGGGLYFDGGTNTIQGDTIIINNVATAQLGGVSQGGGVMVESGFVTFNGSYAEGNTAGQGSGVFINSAKRIYLQGSAQFHLLEDIYKSSTAEIWIIGVLNPLRGTNPKTARITPQIYADNTQILTGDINTPVYLNNPTFFTITPNGAQEWYLIQNGTMWKQ